MAKNSNLSKLWKTEDWLSVWIGFIVILIACIAVLAQAFDFSALSFKTWSWGESLNEAQAAKIASVMAIYNSVGIAQAARDEIARLSQLAMDKASQAGLSQEGIDALNRFASGLVGRAK